MLNDMTVLRAALGLGVYADRFSPKPAWRPIRSIRPVIDALCDMPKATPLSATVMDGAAVAPGRSG